MTASAPPAAPVAAPDAPRRRGTRRPAAGIATVLLLGLLVRVVALTGYSPSVLQWVDGPRYARIGTGLFDEYWWPAGYSAFLIAVRSVWDALAFTIAIQHVLGLVVAALLYAALRRLEVPRLVALVPAAVAALGGDYVYLEHILMADAFFIFLAVAGLYAAVHGMTADPGRARTAWLVGAGALLTGAGLVRTTGLVLPFVFAFVLLTAGRQPLRGRLAGAGAVLVTTAVLVAGYMGLATVGRYDGLFTMGGWHTYARVAPTADCRAFTPPAGTEFLCESTPVAQRQGSLGYEWNAASPARQRFELPDGNEELSSFGRAAVLGQPLTYLKIVAKDTLRNIEPSLGRTRDGSGITGELLVFGYRDGAVEQAVGQALAPEYDGVLPVQADGIELLDSYQRVTRLGGLEKLLMIALALAGAWAARGRLRQGIALFGLSALALFVAPAATLSYDIRYSLPPTLLLAAAAALGGYASWRRWGPSRR